MFQLKLRLLHSVYKKLETRASAHLRLRIRGRRPRLNRNFLEAHFQPKLNQALVNGGCPCQARGGCD